MGTTARRRPASRSPISKPSFHSQRFALRRPMTDPLCLTCSLSLQFFTQSNPLNNLNITSSIPPILQRQNSAPTQQQQQQPQNGDFYGKPSNVHRPVASSAPSHATPSTASEIHRKYSLPMSTLSSQSMVSASSFSQQMMRKQSAPTIQSMEQQFQQQPHGSPSRARDRNSFDKAPSNQDVQQLPLLKGGFKHAECSLYVPFMRSPLQKPLFLLFHLMSMDGERESEWEVETSSGFDLT